jgi:hypothetical protein
MTAQQLYAFWNYDQFPYVLHGRVVHMSGDGYVKIEGYSTMRFRPVLLMPVEAGEKLGEQINAVRAEHKEALAEFNVSWKDRVRELLDVHDVTQRVHCLRREW